jgi:hypothetical protein
MGAAENKQFMQSIFSDRPWLAQTVTDWLAASLCEESFKSQ